MRSSARTQLLRYGKLRTVGILALLVLLVGILVACGSDTAPAPAEEPAAEAPAAEEAAEEEAAEEEATEEPAEEEAAEAEATAPAEEEAEAEATEPAEEEAAEAEATAPAEEEAEAEATAPAEEEAGAEATAEPSEEAASDAPMDDAVAMGGYIVTISGGCGCHMNRDLGGLAGGNEFDTPSGVVLASNITPDEETGIGSWSEEDIAVALHTGATPHGQLHPVMPYMRLSVLSDQEALAVGAYLLSLEPIANEVEHGELSEEPAAYTPENEPPAEPPTDPVARGEQLVTIANCGGCHTPSDSEGMMLAGNMLREEWAKNITPHEETGIGTWSEEEVATYLQTGVRPDGSEVEGAMGQQIARRFSTLTDADATAIAAYLMSIPAVENAAPTE